MSFWKWFYPGLGVKRWLLLWGVGFLLLLYASVCFLMVATPVNLDLDRFSNKGCSVFVEELACVQDYIRHNPEVLASLILESRKRMEARVE